MPWTQKQMLRDANGDLIPQYWDVVEQEFKPLTGSDGANDVRLTGRKVLITADQYEQTLNVSAGAMTTVTITPPVGEMWKIKNLFFDITPPVGATSGTHYVEITYGPSYSVRRRLISLMSNHDKRVRLQDNVAHEDVSIKFPNNDVIIQSNILSLVVTNSMPLSLRYTNATDATQNGTFFIYIVREVEYIA